MKIVISNTVNMPIYEQVVNQIRDAVINGELKAGEGMPSIRVLAKELAVKNRTTLSNRPALFIINLQK